MKDNGFDMIKDVTPYGVIGAGAGAVSVPNLIFQVIGAVGVLAGIVLGILRWLESRRANDIAEQENQIELRKLKIAEESSNNAESQNFESGIST